MGGKLLETLRQLVEEWYAPYTVYCECEQEYEYSVPFPTRIRHVCRMQTNLNCSYIWNIVTRGAGRVVVLIRADGQAWYIWYKYQWRIYVFPEMQRWCLSLTLLNLIAIICHAQWLNRAQKCTRMSQRPLYHNMTSYVCTLLRNRLAQVNHWKKVEKGKENAPPPSLPTSMASPSWNLTSPGTKTARLPYCRCVTVLLWRVFRFAAQPNAGERWLFL